MIKNGEDVGERREIEGEVRRKREREAERGRAGAGARE